MLNPWLLEPLRCICLFFSRSIEAAQGGIEISEIGESLQEFRILNLKFAEYPLCRPDRFSRDMEQIIIAESRVWMGLGHRLFPDDPELIGKHLDFLDKVLTDFRNQKARYMEEDMEKIRSLALVYFNGVILESLCSGKVHLN